ncbi:PREDICTED: protein prune homolog [Amphimedon queenslandica]|uniref:CRAL-TRIO domain-containing protein n=1 Tax=Amphimedon queenslandica TaxID=400682 RepID=A0A1X7VSK6_AMPQE|nr:PREDICTED: protein prune homolog [Amphimedon queenslandica]|eukprot:XP_011404648.2 PREDICTED: protein prune homolog [Amphimedon queenslandica]
MSALSEFVKHASEHIKELDEGILATRLVVGNESCDLDSVACSLSLAHFYWSTISSSFFSLPLLNCLREDLSLRQDIVWLLNHLKIDSSYFLFLPEVSLSDLPHPRVTLVDHNVPDESIRPYVDEIIDHHDDALTFECYRVIEPVGSCSTLVAEKLLSSEDYEMPNDVATFLLSAILIDTGNLKIETRVTEKDVEIAGKLGSFVSLSSDQLYYNVLTAREDVSDLTALQILRKDFKKSEAGNFIVGFSSMTLLVTDFLATKMNATSDLELFSSQQELHILVLLSIQLKPLRRQIALYQRPGLPPASVPADLVDSIAASLEADHQLQVERIGEGLFDGIIMEQGNTSFSRKQILPLIMSCLTDSPPDEVKTHRLRGFPRSETIYLEDPPPLPLPASVKEDEKEREKGREEKGERETTGEEEGQLEPHLTASQQGSLLQLESISARLGESMDSFALAQDSDEERNKTPSPNASLSNLADRSISSIDDPHPHPLEPQVIVSSPAAILPQESDVPPPAIPEYTPEEESKDTRDFRLVMIGGEERRISLKLIELYRPIVQHGGYLGNDQTAIVVISSFYLPPKSLRNYPQVISQLFFYVLSVVEKLVVDDYVIVYLHSGAPRNSMPGIQWFHRFYRMIDRRLRKNLKNLFIVHPSFWVKTMLRLLRPFISRKFYRKVSHINSLKELNEQVKLDAMLIPEAVRSVDHHLNPSHYLEKPDSPTNEK